MCSDSINYFNTLIILPEFCWNSIGISAASFAIYCQIIYIGHIYHYIKCKYVVFYVIRKKYKYLRNREGEPFII